MDLVTLTDHDTIAGGLRLVDRPDFFLSEEITTRFPENDCVMHVLAWNITPAQHELIQASRHDIYRLVDTLGAQGIAHAVAHPLLSPNWRLDADTLEKVLLLFPVLEGSNGLVDGRIADDLDFLLAHLTPEVLDGLARKHGLAARGAAPRRKAVSAGSDDHVHRRCGSTFTEIDGAGLAPAAFLSALTAGAGRARGEPADIDTMAVCIAHTTYEHLDRRRAGRADGRDAFVDIMDRIAGPPDAPTGAGPRPGAPAGAWLGSLVRGAVRAVGRSAQGLDIRAIPDQPSLADDARLVDAMARSSDALAGRALGDLAAACRDADLYRIFGALQDIGVALAAASPFLFAADHFGKQHRQVRRIWDRWTAFSPPAPPDRLAIFSDSVANIDGVSSWCRRFADQARAAGKDVLVAACARDAAGAGATDSGPAAGRRGPTIPLAARFELPLYPGFALEVPSLVGAVDWLWRQRVSHVEISTPGPTGLVGLAAARLLRLPVTASYHTELVELVDVLADDEMITAAARRYTAWFYGVPDRVFAFSRASRDKLVALGVAAGRIETLPVAVSPDEFSPAHASPAVFEDLGIPVGDRPVVLSVGRISDEKNLPLIVDAVERLQHLRPAPMLVVVGDGPAREALVRRCRDRGFVRFVGFQEGEALRRLYASARMFVFASEVDTLGLVNIEALASGLPLLVPARSGIAGLVDHGENAFCYDLEPAALAAAIGDLLGDDARASRLAANGRRFAVERWQHAHFGRIWQKMLRVESSHSVA